MTTYQGLGAYIGIGECSTSYTGQGTVTGYLAAKTNSDSINMSVENVFSDELTYRSRTSAGTAAGRIMVDGSIAHQVGFGISGYAPWHNMMKFLLADAGTHTTGAVYSGYWEDKNTLAAIDNKSLTIEMYRGETAASFLYKGVWVQSLDVQISENSPLEFSWGIMGRDAVSGAKSTPSFQADTQVYFPNANMDCDTWVTWGGSKPGRVLSAGININAPLEEQFDICSRYMDQPSIGGVMEVTANLEVAFENRTIFDDFKAGTKRDLVITINGGNSRTFVLTLRNAIITDGGDPHYDGFGAVTYNATFQALADPSVPENAFRFTYTNTATGS